MFVWKLYEAKSKFLFLRHKNFLWKLKVVKANCISFIYTPSKKSLTCEDGFLDKAICWPDYRLSFNSLLGEMKSSKKVPLEPYKFIMNSTDSYLHELGVDLNLCDSSTGASLLHYAAGKDDPHYIQCVVNKFEKKDLLDKQGLTPLHYACKRGLFEQARILLESGADANIAAKDGSTCLMLIAKRKKHDTRLVKLLLKHNASCEAENKENMRALDIARNMNKNSPIIKLIHPMLNQI